MCRAEGLRPATPAEAKARGIPPAYTNVMISDDPNADLQATARTAAGKTFYLYSKAFTARSAEAKWRRVRKLNAERMQRIEPRQDLLGRIELFNGKNERAEHPFVRRANIFCLILQGWLQIKATRRKHSRVINCLVEKSLKRSRNGHDPRY